MISVIIKFILLAIFNVSFFSITKASCSFSMWVSYGFIQFAFLMFFLEPLFVKNSKNTKHVSVESISLITIIYFFCALIVGLFFLFNPLLVIYQYSVESFAVGIYLIILIITLVLNNKIALDERESLSDKQLLNNIYMKAEFIKTKIVDKKIIIEFQDQVKYSPVKSSAIVKDIENEIINILDNITLNIETIQSDKIVGKIRECKDLLNKRNLILKKR